MMEMMIDLNLFFDVSWLCADSSGDELHGAWPAPPRSQVAAVLKRQLVEQKRMEKNVGAAHYLLDLC